MLSFDTNDRHAQQVSLVAARGSELADGQTFTISDGVRTVTFEYDDQEIVAGPSNGVAQGHIPVPFRSTDSAEQVARSIRDAINSPQATSVLNVLAGLSDGTVNGVSGTRVVHLHGLVATTTKRVQTLKAISNLRLPTQRSRALFSLV